MHILRKYFLLGIVIGLLPTGMWVLRVNAQMQQPVKFIFTTPTPTPFPTDTPTPTPTPIPTPTPSPLPTPTPTPLPLPVNASDINALIDRYAGQYAVAADSLRHIAMCESGYNPAAVNGPYGGLYQFSASAWKTYRSMIGKDTDPALRFSAEESVRTAAFVVSIKSYSPWPSCGQK